AVTGGEIYVVDTGNERVQVFGLDGTFKRAFGGHGSEPGKLLEPVGIALGKGGRVYVADSGNARISVFASNGTPLPQRPLEARDGRGLLRAVSALRPGGQPLRDLLGDRVDRGFRSKRPVGRLDQESRIGGVAGADGHYRRARRDGPDYR